jgi:hypothetical protein
MAGRRCLFCDAVGVTAEHVWPRWLARALPLGLSEQLVSTRSAGPDFSPVDRRTILLGGELRLTVKAACRACNNGWMAALEAGVQPVLTDLMSGRHRGVISAEKQRLLARWAVKTAGMLQRVRPDGAVMLSSQYRSLRAGEEPPPCTAVRLARFGGEPGLRAMHTPLVRRELWSPRHGTREERNASVTAMLFHDVLLSVYVYAGSDGAGANMDDAKAFSLQRFRPVGGTYPIWPVTPLLEWPPREVISDAQLPDVFGWTGARPPEPPTA